jgi:hypothetical protein
MFAPLLYALAVVAAFIDVRLCMAVCTALWIFWAATAMQSSQA